MITSNSKGFVYSLFVFASLLTISGCRYYERSISEWQPPSSFIERSSGADPSNNHYIFHFADQVMELTNIVINKTEKTISGKSVPFAGLQKKYYEKIKNSNTQMRSRQEGHLAAIKQVHIYVNEYAASEDFVYLTIKFEDITKVEVTKSAHGINFIVVASITAVTVASIIGALVIVCNCPHVYINNGTSYELNTTLFTGAKAPQLERHDYKVLPDYFKDSAKYEIKVVNEQDENQFTNLIELMAVYHDANSEVLTDKNGRLHSISKPVIPKKATDNSQKNILPKLSRADNDPFTFSPDSMSELSEAFITFNKPANITNGKLVLTLRNSKWSGLVYDEFNSLFGKRHKEWVKRNKNKSKEDRVKWMKEQGINLLVELKTPEGWKSIELVDLVGDVSYNSIVIPMQFKTDDKEVELRIRSGFMFWELDYAAMDYTENIQLHTQILKPVSAHGNKEEDFVTALSADDSFYMEHLGSVSSTLIKFEPIKLQTGKKRTIIIHSKGYYIYNKEYSGKTYRKELTKFTNPGELSRFSKRLYDDAIGNVVIIE